jgi:hypothetical protein
MSAVHVGACNREEPKFQETSCPTQGKCKSRLQLQVMNPRPRRVPKTTMSIWMFIKLNSLINLKLILMFLKVVTWQFASVEMWQSSELLVAYRVFIRQPYVWLTKNSWEVNLHFHMWTLHRLALNCILIRFLCTLVRTEQITEQL